MFRNHYSLVSSLDYYQSLPSVDPLNLKSLRCLHHCPGIRPFIAIPSYSIYICLYLAMLFSFRHHPPLTIHEMKLLFLLIEPSLLFTIYTLFQFISDDRVLLLFSLRHCLVDYDTTTALKLTTLPTFNHHYI